MLDYWTKPPIDPILKIYVFNYTNIDNVLRGLDKRIKIEEVGPYVYRERIEKTGMKFEGHKITFHVRIIVINLQLSFFFYRLYIKGKPNSYVYSTFVKRLKHF